MGEDAARCLDCDLLLANLGLQEHKAVIVAHGDTRIRTCTQ